MAIVTKQYYDNTYMGGAVDAADFAQYEARAEQIIDLLTGGAIYETLPESVFVAVQNAICAEIDFFTQYGVEIATTGHSEVSYTLGKIRVDNGTRAGETAAANMISPLALSYLERTGLLYRAIPVLDTRGFWV